MYVSVCVSIYSLYIYISHSIYCAGGWQVWSLMKMSWSYDPVQYLYLYIYICVLCECQCIDIYIYIKGGDGLYPLWSQVEATIPFNIYCSEGVGGFDPLRQVVGERPGFFQRSLPGIWAADATSPSNQAADTQPQLRLGDPIYRLFLAWELPSYPHLVSCKVEFASTWIGKVIQLFLGIQLAFKTGCCAAFCFRGDNFYPQYLRYAPQVLHYIHVHMVFVGVL